MRTNNVTTGKEATEGLIKGFKIASNAIRPTYGHRGLNGAVEVNLPPYHIVANDAFTLVQAMKTTDPVERRGLAFAQELMARADSTAGNGRKTTLIMADEIMTAGFESEIDKNTLRDEMNALIPVIEGEIDKLKKEITDDDVEAVATVASESPRIGKLLGEIYKKIGKDGIIHLEGSGTWNDDVKYIEGVRFQNTGFLSPYMVHDEQAIKDKVPETQAIYENPTILVTKRKMTHVNDINPLLSTMQKEGKKDLVIFTDDMDSTVAALLVKLHRDKIMNILIIKAPVLWKQYVFEDFAKITGSTIVEDASGINYKNLAFAHLGTCGKIIVDKDETTVVGIADISSHLRELEKEGTTDAKLRLSWLQTKTAILKLGANNESELSYLRLKTADAINSSRLALRDGVVEGAGFALNKIAPILIGTEAGGILYKALNAPMEQLMVNTNQSFDVYVENERVVDSSLITKHAVRNAISLASTILTIGVVIHTPEPTEAELAMMQSHAPRAF